jgi:hypothetical protein
LTIISATQAYFYNSDALKYDYYYLGDPDSSHNSLRSYQDSSIYQDERFYQENYPAPSNYFTTNYVYYGDNYYNGNLPVVTGPYPGQYLFHEDMGIEYKYDDFRGYDNFVGYSDLDVYYPSTGVIDIIRNPNPKELDKSIIPEGMKTFGKHVYGYIPGPDGTCAMYTKHYGHEHEWEMDTYSYGYDYSYQYYTPWLAYKTVPQTTRSCQSTSACQYNYCAACNR